MDNPISEAVKAALDTEGTNDECHITMSLSNGYVRISHCNRSFGMALDHWPPGSSETAYLLRRLADMFSPEERPNDE